MSNVRSANLKGLVSISVFRDYLKPTVLVKNDFGNKVYSNIKDNIKIHTVERPPDNLVP
jgi:hypothetical protein